MAKPPLHKLCNTAHWSTERCPAMKAAPRAAVIVQPGRNAGKTAATKVFTDALFAVKNGPGIVGTASKVQASEAARDGVVLKSMAHPEGPGVGRGRGRLHKDALETVNITLPPGTKVQKRSKKPSAKKKLKSGSRVTKPRVAAGATKTPPAPKSRKAAALKPLPDPKKMTVPELVAYVTADLRRKSKARAAKAQAQQRWREKKR